jgi:hypothetical protein
MITDSTITARLHLWATFFATGTESMPADATDDAYGLDMLVDMGRASPDPEVRMLAGLVESAGITYQVQMMALEDMSVGVGTARQ